MNRGRIEQASEEIKAHLSLAAQHKDRGDDAQMRAEVKMAAALFQPLIEVGDPLGVSKWLQAALRSFGYEENESSELLSPPRSSTSMKKTKKSGKNKKDAKTSHVQPQYIKPPSTLPGFKDAVPVGKKGGRKRWHDKKAKRIYEWDYQHGHVEGWDNTGKKHQGAFNPNDGTLLKPPDPTKKPITLEIVENMTKKERYALCWYSVEDETLVGEEDVRLSQDTVRKWFFLPEDDPAILCYDVTASQRQHLLKLVDTDIDLNEYVYLVEGRAEE